MFERINQDTLSEYESFISAHPKGHFMQSHMWAAQKPNWKWEALAVRNAQGAITATLAVLIRKVPGMPFTLMYGCRGPVCDPDDRAALEELISGARALAKKHRSYVLKLDPDIPSSNTAFSDMLVELGFQPQSSGKNFEGFQPRYVFRLDIQDKSEDEVFALFHSKTRYNIRLAQRKGVTVRLCGREAVGEFSSLMLETGVRDGFVTRGKGYFEAMLDNLGEHARLYMAYSGQTPVAGTLAIWFGDKVWYLYGASSNEHRNLMPNYLLQWSMICWAIEKKCRVYDFRGVSGDLSEDNPLYGLYRFKKGFNGEFTEFAGEFDLIFNSAAYAFVQKGQRAFRHARKVLFLAKNKLGRAKNPPQESEQGSERA